MLTSRTSLSAEYRFDDAVWADIARQASDAVQHADARIAEACRQVGVPENLRPGLTIGWRSRGENALASRRAELRKLAHARIDAAAESAKVSIESSLLEVETELIRDGLETAAAVAYVQAMPTRTSCCRRWRWPSSTSQGRTAVLTTPTTYTPGTADGCHRRRRPVSW